MRLKFLIRYNRRGSFSLSCFVQYYRMGHLPLAHSIIHLLVWQDYPRYSYASSRPL